MGVNGTMNDILIVDDERDIRELISEILQDEGLETRLAGTSDECMSALAASTVAGNFGHLAERQRHGRD